ncbi:MAG: BON domain-containing protein [Ramlibacter sp.]
MKTDQQLKSDVAAELAWDPIVNETRIGVAVKNGVVTLSGQVDSYLQKHAAERAVRRLAGVRGLALDLEVHLADGAARSDAELAQTVVHALTAHALVPEGNVQATVEDGWVTLTGEVDWGFQSASAEQCVHPLIGVRGVTNQIRLKQRANPADIRAQLEAALARHAQREARRIAVEVDGGVVTLSGTVESMAELDAVMGTARAAKGVTRVVDQLEVID